MSDDLISIPCLTLFIWPRGASHMALHFCEHVKEFVFIIVVICVEFCFFCPSDLIRSASVHSTFLSCFIYEFLSILGLFIELTESIGSVLAIFKLFVRVTSLPFPYWWFFRVLGKRKCIVFPGCGNKIATYIPFGIWIDGEETFPIKMSNCLFWRQ